MVTAETAVTIPAVLLVLALGLAGIGGAISLGQACFAARTAARVIMVGQSDDVARAQAIQAAPGVGSVAISHAGDLATVSVQMSGNNPFSAKCSVSTIKETSLP